MRKVFRIEHRVKKFKTWFQQMEEDSHYAGPFHTSVVDDIPYHIEEKMSAPPCPGAWFDKTGWIFGFHSVKAMCNWFDEECLEFLASIDYVIAVYEVSNDNVVMSPLKEQLAFNPRTARKVKRTIYKGSTTIQELKRYG